MLDLIGVATAIAKTVLTSNTVCRVCIRGPQDLADTSPGWRNQGPDTGLTLGTIRTILSVAPSFHPPITRLLESCGPAINQPLQVP